MKRVPMLMLGLSVVLLSAMSLQAQERPPEGRRAPGGGMGGGPGGDLNSLLVSEQVQKALELSEDQVSQLRRLAEEARSARGERPNLRDLSDEARQARMTEMREQAQARAREARSKIEGVLLPHQFQRLEQISLQVRGVGALNDPAVAEKLGITDEQREKLTAAQTANRERARESMQGANREDREAMRQRMETARAEAESRVLEVLTAEQRSQFEAMKGEKFELDLSQLRGGQRRPGAEGQQPQRNRPEGARRRPAESTTPAPSET